MTGRNIIVWSIITVLLTMMSCKEKENKDEVIIYTNSTTNALVTSFMLQQNTNVLNNLDSVFFTIDPVKNRIYNADSLPVGTDVRKLLTTITFNATVESAKFYLTYSENGQVKRDTITYSSSSRDSLNFTGSAVLEVKAYDGEHTKRYDVFVNVHQVNPDTIVWPEGARTALPAATAGDKCNRAVQWGSKVVSLLQTAGDGYRISIADSPTGTWTTVDFSGGFTPDVHSLAANDKHLYVLDQSGSLYVSDDAINWQNTGIKWHSVIGCYEDHALGITADAEPKFDEYPRHDGYTPKSLPASFPMSGRSQLVQMRHNWTVSPQVVMVGGTLADGSVTNKAWGYDGSSWAVISAASDTLPALRDVMLVSYFTYDISTTNWKVTKHATWLIMGGFKSDGTPNRTTYMSRNQGITWSKAPSGLQWPAHMPSIGGAQALIHYHTLTANGSPRRVSKPVTEWDCPYIYLMGGYNAEGTLLTDVWCGVLNRLTQKPVY